MTIASRRLAAVVGAVIAFGAAAAPAHAQSVEAEALFRDGKRLMKEGKVAEACDKYEASDRLEPSVGTKLNLADCREKNHQLATAWATFLKASAEAKQAGNDTKREAEARRRATALEPRLAYLTISVSDASRVEGLEIKRNGAAVDPALWNTGVPVDAGTYEISGQAPGHEPWSTKVEITSEGQKASVEVPRFKRLEDLQPAVGATKPPATKPIDTKTADTKPSDERPVKLEEPPPPEEEDHGPSHFTGMRKVAVGVAVLGVAGVALGAVYGSKANDLESQSDAKCPGTMCMDMTAVQLNADARSDATIANIGIIGGGALVAGAAVMWFVGAPKAGERVAITPVVGGDRVGFAIGGSF